MPTRLVLLVASTLMLSAACGAAAPGPGGSQQADLSATSPGHASPSAEPSGVAFQPVVAPPVTPPVVSVGRVAGMSAYLDWVEHHKVLHHEPTSRITWPQLVSGRRVSVTLRTPVPPEQVDLRFFSSLPPSGVPTGSPRVVNCVLHRQVQQDSGCVVSKDPRGFTVTASTDHARLLLANVRWYLPLADRAGLVDPPLFDNEVVGWRLAP